MNFSNLTWVLQNNAIGEPNYSALTTTLLKLGVNVEAITVIPFSHLSADPLPTINGPCIVYGSSGLLKVANKAKWSPAGWDGHAFQIDVANDKLGNKMLNHAALITEWSKIYDVAKQQKWDNVFTRPVSETKEFAGQTYNLSTLKIWINKLNDSGYFEHNDNLAIIAPIQNIGREWRVFVIDNKLVSMCQYALNGKPNQQTHVPTEMTTFLEDALKIYSPSPCFVVDVAEIFDNNKTQLKIVEFNSINSAGFYACDIATIVTELSKFAIKF